jgi:hypothetical protein
MANSHRFYDRYTAGEYVPVWKELIALGEVVCAEPLRSEAIQVCKEIVRRASINLRMLHTRLLNLGYEFAEPNAAFVEAVADPSDRIDEFEQELGAMPLIARTWYSVIASVDFRQADSQRVYRQALRPPAGPDIFGLGSHPVLLFQSLARSQQQFQEMAEEQEGHMRQPHGSDLEGSEERVPFASFFPLSGWASNCDPVGFRLPCLGVDGVIFNDGGGDAYFVDQLRGAFRWGGFPFWQGSLKKADFYSPFEYRPNFAKLLPHLKEGLLEL